MFKDLILYLTKENYGKIVKLIEKRKDQFDK